MLHIWVLTAMFTDDVFHSMEMPAPRVTSQRLNQVPPTSHSHVSARHGSIIRSAAVQPVSTATTTAHSHSARTPSILSPIQPAQYGRPGASQTQPLYTPPSSAIRPYAYYGALGRGSPQFTRTYPYTGTASPYQSYSNTVSSSRIASFPNAISSPPVHHVLYNAASPQAGPSRGSPTRPSRGVAQFPYPNHQR